MLFEFIDWVIDVSPAFIHFMTESLNEPFIDDIRRQAEHAGLKPLKD